jgi:hypothetical protein
MDGLAENLYPMTDEEVELLWESHGLSVEELEQLYETEKDATTRLDGTR